MRIGFVFFVLIHGLIHLMGFLKEWKLADMKQLNGQTLFLLTGYISKTVGILWLLTSILFIITAIFILLRLDWWIIAFLTVLLSQSLIIIYWHDARFGTIANIIILVFCIFSYKAWSFEQMVNKEIGSFLAEPLLEKTMVDAKRVNGLPHIVQKWLNRSGVINNQMTQNVYLTQTGQMKINADGKWMPFKAKQFFDVTKPGFLWKVDVNPYPNINIVGRDKFENGKGHMLIKVLSLFTVADAKGKEIDQGTLIRYMAENIWFPSGVLNEYFSWEEIDNNNAKATINYKGVVAAGIFNFSDDGDFISFTAKRFYERKEGATLEDWFVSSDRNSYKEFEGIRIPTKFSITWKLKTGDFQWLKLEITDIKYNSFPNYESQKELPILSKTGK